MKPTHPWLLLLLAVMLLACGGADIALINEVKRFEPEWSTLAEKVSKIDRTLLLARERYRADLDSLSAYIPRADSDVQSELYGIRSTYRGMMMAHEQIRDDFDDKKADFTQVVYDFNAWETLLMKNKTDPHEAPVAFRRYQLKAKKLRKEIHGLEGDLQRNIELHNSLMRQVGKLEGDFVNYDINPA